MAEKINKLAVLRGDGVGRACPYGLQIPISCKSAGDSVFSMEVLADLPEEEREHQKQVNRRLYRHSNDGTKCPFLEGVVKAAKYDTVNCDQSDSNAGSHEIPFRASPYYPRIGAGYNVNVLYGYGFSAYNDTKNDYYFGGLNRAAGIQDGGGFWLVAGDLAAEDFAQDQTLQQLGQPSSEEYEVVAFDIGAGKVGSPPSDKAMESFKANSLQTAKEWAEARIGPGKKIEIEGKLRWEPAGEVESEDDLLKMARQWPKLVWRDDERFLTHEALEQGTKAYGVQEIQLFFRLQSQDGAPYTEQYRKLEATNIVAWVIDGQTGSLDGPWGFGSKTLEMKTTSPESPTNENPT